MNNSNRSNVVCLYLVIFMLCSLAFPSLGYNQGQTVLAQQEDPDTALTYTDLDFGFTFLYPSGLTYQKWEPTSDILASTSFFAVPAEVDKVPILPEVSVTVFANQHRMSAVEWAELRADPQKADELPAGTPTFKIIESIQRLTFDGRPAVIFAESSLGVIAGRLLIEDGERIISIVYTDFGQGQMKPAFVTIAASFRFTPASPSIDPQLQEEISRVISSYPSHPSQLPPGTNQNGVLTPAALPVAGGAPDSPAIMLTLAGLVLVGAGVLAHGKRTRHL